MPRRSGPPGTQLCRAAGCRQSTKSVNAAGAGGGEPPSSLPLREWPWPRELPSGRSGGAAPSPIQPGHPPAAPCAPGLRPGGAGEGPGRGGGCPRWGSTAPRLLPGRGLRGFGSAPRISAAARSRPRFTSGPPRLLGGGAQPPGRPAPRPARQQDLGGRLPSPGGFPRKGCEREDGTRGRKWRRLLAFFPPVVWVLLGNCV